MMDARLLMAAAMLSMGGIQAVASTARDTVVIEKPEEVVIRNQENGYEVEVRGKQDNPDYRYVHKRSFERDSIEVVSESNSSDGVDFNIPFSRYWKKNRHGRRYAAHWAGFGFGFCNAVQTSTGGLNGVEGVSTNMGRSYELFFNFASAGYRLGGGFGVFTGLGVDWRNFRMDNGERFVKTDNKVHLEDYPEGAEVQFSRFKMFSITVPFMVEWQSSARNAFFVNLGPVVNLNTYASYKTRYKVDGRKVKEMIHDVHQLPVSVDFMAQVGCSAMSFYVKYSPCRLVQEAYGPEMHPFSCGLVLQF